MDEPQQTGRDIDTVIDGIGARLRSLRRTRTMTLAGLAEATAHPRPPCPGSRPGRDDPAWTSCCGSPAPTE